MKQSYTVERGSLEGVEAFLRVATRKSFRQAADDLGVTPSSISQVIRVLEQRLGVALFTRTTRSVGLTEAGENFFAEAKPAFEGLVAASEAARTMADRPSGLLRLAVPRAAVPLILEPLLASFCDAYPDVTVEIVASEELVDLAKDGFDAGIRMGQFIGEDMVAIRLTPPFRLVFVASPTYLQKYRYPATLDDLREHRCIRIRRNSGAVGNWLASIQGRTAEIAVEGPMVANDFPTILGAALASVGMAQVPEPIALEHLTRGGLVELLRGFAPGVSGMFLFHSGRRQVLPKLRAFIEHVKATRVPAAWVSTTEPATDRGRRKRPEI